MPVRRISLSGPYMRQTLGRARFRSDTRAAGPAAGTRARPGARPAVVRSGLDPPAGRGPVASMDWADPSGLRPPAQIPTREEWRPTAPVGRVPTAWDVSLSRLALPPPVSSRSRPAPRLWAAVKQAGPSGTTVSGSTVRAATKSSSVAFVKGRLDTHARCGLPSSVVCTAVTNVPRSAIPVQPCRRCARRPGRRRRSRPGR